jgi:hypothetical protein
MMACTICQASNDSAVWGQVIRLVFFGKYWWLNRWAEWASGCGTNTSWTEEFVQVSWFVKLRSQYLTDITLLDMFFLQMLLYLTGLLLIVSWGCLPKLWCNWRGFSSDNMVIWDVQYHGCDRYLPKGYVGLMLSFHYYCWSGPDNSSITPGVSSSPSGSSSSSKSTNVGAIVGGTIGALAALSLFAVGAYLVYRRHVYKQGAYASVINQQPFIDRGDGAATRMTHDSVPPDSSNFSQSFVSPVLYGQSPPTSQYGTVYSPQPQMAFSSLQGSLSPPPRPVTSLHTTHIMQPSDAIPML